jgi:hypothetical protein
MIEKVLSKNGILIRLTNERWAHIVEEHCELAGMRLEVLETVSCPLRILVGGAGELLAVREVSPAMNLVVVYRELEDDGFIITAFVTSKMRSLNRRNQIWPK